MEKIVLWGTGKLARKLLPVLTYTVILVVDNDKSKWGTVWNGYIVSPPASIKDFYGKFDRIIIATANWKIIREQILDEFCVEPGLIDNMYYRQREALLKFLEKNREADKEKYFSFLNQYPLDVFNDFFSQRYGNLDLRVFYDSEKRLYYLYHNSKKMYFSSEFSNEDQVKRYYSFLLMEQDIHSPHRYQTKSFHVCQHDIVLDAGVAEGNFALDIIDLVDKLYLVECDENWIHALKYTFEPYKDKVEIVEGMLGDGSQGSITIDDIVGKNRINFIKMDIEGAERLALSGAKRSLIRNNVKLDICVYHNFDDEEKIRQLLDEFGYQSEASEGYMVFTERLLEKETPLPRFVRGLVRGRKNVTLIC